MSSLNLYGSYAPYRTPSTASEDDGVLKNFISPEVRAKIMTGRLFTVVEEGENWPDFGFFYYASKWSEIYECLDDDDDGDAPDELVGVGSVCCYEGQTEPGSLSWVEWEELLRGNLCGRAFGETDDLVLSPANNEEGGYAWSTDDFSRGEKLGRGAFGIVYAVQERRTGIVVAIKAVDKRMVEQRKCTLQIQRETQLQFGLTHQNVCRLFDHFDDRHRIYLVLEFAPNGTLANLLKTLAPSKTLPESLSARFLRMLAAGLDYIHTLGIIHRDVKPENLLLGSRNILKLADFGWAVPERDASACTVFCGTEEYLAPEMLKRVRVTTQLDMWAAGVVLYEMLVGRTPFRGANRAETFCGILRGEFVTPSAQLSVGAKVLVVALLCQKPEMRLTAERVWYDRWVREQGEED